MHFSRQHEHVSALLGIASPRRRFAGLRIAKTRVPRASLEFFSLVLQCLLLCFCGCTYRAKRSEESDLLTDIGLFMAGTFLFFDDALLKCAIRSVRCINLCALGVALVLHRSHFAQVLLESLFPAKAIRYEVIVMVVFNFHVLIKCKQLQVAAALCVQRRGRSSVVLPYFRFFCA